MTGETRIRAAAFADCASMAEVHVETWRDTYADLLPTDYLVGMSAARLAAEWRRALSPTAREIVLVAERPGEGVVAFASGGPNRDRAIPAAQLYRGEIYTLYVGTSHQGRGIGRQLVAAMGEHLVRSALDPVLVWVVAGNPARFFYRRLGGRQVAERRERFAGAEIDQLAFGWADLRRSVLPSARNHRP